MAPKQLHFSVAWAGRRLSGDLTSAIFHSESRLNLENFFAPLGPRGVEFSGPIWSPARLFVNLANWSFVAAVPLLYGAIYKFRKAHAGTTIGTNIAINSAFPLFFEPLSPLSKLKGIN